MEAEGTEDRELKPESPKLLYNVLKLAWGSLLENTEILKIFLLFL